MGFLEVKKITQAKAEALKAYKQIVLPNLCRHTHTMRHGCLKILFRHLIALVFYKRVMPKITETPEEIIFNELIKMI